MNEQDLFKRAVNHVYYASGVGQNFLRNSHDPVFQTTGYVVPNLTIANRIIQSDLYFNNIHFFDLNGVAIPSPDRNPDFFRLLTDKNLIASIFPVITPTLARKLVDPAIGPLLRMEDTHNLIVSASPSWLPWAGAVDQLLKKEAVGNIEIFHSVKRNRNIPTNLENSLDHIINKFHQAGLNTVNISHFFDIRPYPEIMGTDLLKNLPWYGDGNFLHAVAHKFFDAEITPILRAFMVNTHIQKLGFDAARVDVLNGKFEPVSI